MHWTKEIKQTKNCKPRNEINAIQIKYKTIIFILFRTNALNAERTTPTTAAAATIKCTEFSHHIAILLCLAQFSRR